MVSSVGGAIGFYGRNTPAKAATIGNGVSVKKSKLGPLAGRGLFVDERFASGNYITEYGGELIDDETAESRRNDPKNYGTHIRTLWHGQLHIDGINVPNANGQGGGSFANDSHTVHNAVGRSLYNAVFEIVENSVGVERPFADTVRKPRSARLGPPIAPVRVFLKAIRTIEPGEEVYVWYGNEYWKQPNIQKHMENNCSYVFSPARRYCLHASNPSGVVVDNCVAEIVQWFRAFCLYDGNKTSRVQSPRNERSELRGG